MDTGELVGNAWGMSVVARLLHRGARAGRLARPLQGAACPWGLTNRIFPIILASRCGGSTAAEKGDLSCRTA